METWIEEKKKEFEKAIRDYTDNLVFGKQDKIMTDMLEFTQELWKVVEEAYERGSQDSREGKR